MTLAPPRAIDAQTSALGAPFFIGITGKRDLKGFDAPVRAALDRAFDILDRKLPHTPKIVLTALASGADSLAAEAALAREGWRVVAPLPFRRATYEGDFTEPGALQRLSGLLADPRVHGVELSPLRRAVSDRVYADDELVRTTPSSPDRTLHYEQAGLYIVERCALLIGVVEPDEGPGLVGGAGRILEACLNGLDATALDVRDRSTELLQEGGLADPRKGPIWRILFDPEAAGPTSPSRMTVQLPDGPAMDADSHPRIVAQSLELGLRIDEINRHAAAAQGGGAASAPQEGIERLAWLRQSLSVVQQRMKARVRWSVWFIAALFAAAVVALELHASFEGRAWAERLGVLYFLCAAGAIALYVLAGIGRWQPLAEDYRAMSEALRVQMVLWQSGLTGPNSRVDLQYLKGKRGSLGMVRDAVGQLAEGARLWRTPTARNATAVESWADNQFDYFSRRIVQRQASVNFSRASGWFLFVAGIVLSACVAAMQVEVFERLAAWLTVAPWTAPLRWAGLAAAAGLTALCFLCAQQVQRRSGSAHRTAPVPVGLRVAGLGAAIVAGLAVAFALCGVAALVSMPPGSAPDLRVDQAEKLLIMGAVVATTLAGAIRFVSDKLSWEAELEGYEHAMGFFRRARQSLAVLAQAPNATSAQREALIVELAAEALRENESWLLAHRERPLEPVVGG